MKKNLSPLKGLQDRTGLEMKVLRFAGAKLSETFQRHGFEEIETPLIESPLTWAGDKPISKKRKFTDIIFGLKEYIKDEGKFKLLRTIPAELRPEGTLPVCRFLANRIIAGNTRLPLRVFYVTPMFRNEDVRDYSDTKKLMFYQAGLELIGPKDPIADIAVIEIAAESIADLGFKGKTSLRLSDMGLFEGLMELITPQKRELREQRFQKMRSDMKEAIDNISKYRAQKNEEKEREARKNLDRLISLYGISNENRAHISLITDNIGHLSQMASTFSALKSRNARISRAISELEFISTALLELDVSHSIDPAVVRGLDIYTGPVFQLDIELPNGRVIDEAAGGGRYDNDVGRFLEGVGIKGRKVPATGFAYGLDRVVSAIIQTSGLPEKASVNYNLLASSTDFLVSGENPVEILKTARELRKDGHRVEVEMMKESREKIEKYAREHKIGLILK